MDVRAAMLRHAWEFRRHYVNEVEKISKYRNLVGAGVSGALILGLFSDYRSIGWFGYLWNPKGHGVEWSPRPEPGTRVVLVDDVATTGGTLRRLREACEAAGLVVVGEVVAVRREP